MIDSTELSPESDEWIAELVDGWVEVYKKSMLAVVVLRIVADTAPVSAGVITNELAAKTQWVTSERALYRTLQRLRSSGLVDSTRVTVPRTGAKRQDFELTRAGAAYLAEVEKRMV